MADAKNKACELSEAVKEMEKLSLMMAEESAAMLKLAEHFYRECTVVKLPFIPTYCEFSNLIILNNNH